MEEDNKIKCEEPAAEKFTAKESGIAYSFSSAFPALLQIIIMLIASIVLQAVKGDPEALTKNAWYIWALLLANQLAFFAVSAVLMKRRCARPDCFLNLQNKAIRGKTARYILLGEIFTVGLVFFMSPIVTYFIEGLKNMGYVSNGVNIPDITVPYNFIMAFIIVGLLPAILEETLFRGIILTGLKKYGAVFAILMSSLMFMLMHQSIEQSVYQFLFAVALGYVALKTQSTAATICMHFTNNLIILVTEIITASIGMPALPAVKMWEWIAMAIGGVLVISVILYEFVLCKNKVTREETGQTENRVPKKVFFAYAAFGFGFNIIMLIVGLFT